MRAPAAWRPIVRVVMLLVFSLLPALMTQRRLAGPLLGFGLGGLADGILLHQILQWHHLISARTADPAANMVADGVFAAFMWLIVVAGAWRLWAEGRDAGLHLFGTVLIGWGVFHMVDSIAFHALLGLHHIWPSGPGGEAAWDWGFLLLGLGLLASGLALARTSPCAAPDSTGHGQ